VQSSASQCGGVGDIFRDTEYGPASPDCSIGREGSGGDPGILRAMSQENVDAEHRRLPRARLPHPGRHLHWQIVRRRPRLLAGGSAAALLAVVGPGMLAGLSDDDPAGITTYSILGAKYGYQLLWILSVSTAALIVYHLVGARMGVVTGKGLLTLVRERFGQRGAAIVLSALVIANAGTLCAEFAGVAAAMQLLAGVSRYVSVPFAAVGVSVLVLRGSFRRVEHVFLALSAVFVAYILSGFLSHPDWVATAKGTVVPSIPLNRDAVLVAVATVGTTLAPWGLTFIQSYAVDKRLQVKDLRFETVDVVVGAVLTGTIGMFVVVSCAATLHAQGMTTINDASDAARALRPLAGHLASSLFGFGFLGAALLAAAIVPLSTAYSVAEAFGRPADVNDRFESAKLFYSTFGVVVLFAVGVVLAPGAPLIPILFLTQALNAVLLLAILPFLRSLASDREVMGQYALGPLGRWATGLALALVAVSVLALGLLSVF
jgi:NRAMP (natural resistance-associated macrophage protein)-like metal ion transporter